MSDILPVRLREIHRQKSDDTHRRRDCRFYAMTQQRGPAMFSERMRVNLRWSGPDLWFDVSVLRATGWVDVLHQEPANGHEEAAKAAWKVMRE